MISYHLKKSYLNILSCIFHHKPSKIILFFCLLYKLFPPFLPFSHNRRFIRVENCYRILLLPNPHFDKSKFHFRFFGYFWILLQICLRLSKNKFLFHFSRHYWTSLHIYLQKIFPFNHILCQTHAFCYFPILLCKKHFQQILLLFLRSIIIFFLAKKLSIFPNFI